MKISAYAKINLALNVASRRSDGYHELEMVMAPIDLCDEIEVEFSDQDSYEWNLDMPILASNTMVRAVQVMRETYHLKQCFKITCQKKIPMEAGLAGGSADAAAVMRGIQALCQLDVSLEALSLLGKKIGADVPFCVLNRCAVVKGIGEKIEPFEFDADFEILLVKPKQGVPTGKCFQMLDLNQCDHPHVETVKEYLMANRFDELKNVAFNSLESSAFTLVKEIAAIKNSLIEAGFEFVLMSGSGSCVFACTQNQQLLRKFIAKNAKKYDFICQTHLLKVKKVN